jgi:hypothetical protein
MISELRDNTRMSPFTCSVEKRQWLMDRYHAWESLAMKYLRKLSPHRIRHEDNSFNRLVRPYVCLSWSAVSKLTIRFIGPNDDKIYKAWKGED